MPSKVRTKRTSTSIPLPKLIARSDGMICDTWAGAMTFEMGKSVVG